MLLDNEEKKATFANSYNLFLPSSLFPSSTSLEAITLPKEENVADSINFYIKLEHFSVRRE